MTFSLDPAERDLVGRIPEQDITEMAVDLDLLLDEGFDRESLVLRCIEALLDRAEVEGIPLSKWDGDDLRTLPPEHFQALARTVGLTGKPSVRAMLKAGARTWRQYRKTRPNSATALLIPTLLGPIARAAYLRQMG